MVVFSAVSRVKRFAITFVATGFILAVAIGTAGAAPSGQLKSSINPYLIPPWLGTWSGLYLSPKEAYDAARRSGVVFVDVRYSEEVKKDGSPNGLDGHVPWVRMAPLKLGGYTVYQPQINPNFVNDLKSLVANRGGRLGRTPVILISTSGERSARAADFLHKAGFGEVYTVVYGFTGGEHPEDRAQSWQGVNLPHRGKTARASLR
jgi:rhodanese-related sulfurtransferase